MHLSCVTKVAKTTPSKKKKKHYLFVYLIGHIDSVHFDNAVSCTQTGQFCWCSLVDFSDKMARFLFIGH